MRTYAVPADFEVVKHVLEQPVTRISDAPSYRHHMTALHPDGSLSVRGVADGAATYLATWPPGKAPDGSFLFAEGELYRGGLALGLVRNGRWIAQADVTQVGPFRIMIPVEPGPDYEVILANRLTAGGPLNAFDIQRLGWLPLKPPEVIRISTAAGR